MDRRLAIETLPAADRENLHALVMASVWFQLLALGTSIAIAAVIALIFAREAIALLAVPAAIAGGALAALAWRKTLASQRANATVAPTGAA